MQNVDLVEIISEFLWKNVIFELKVYFYWQMGYYRGYYHETV